MKNPKLILIIAALALSGCTPLVVGAGAVVITDEILERENGDDGLI